MNSYMQSRRAKQQHQKTENKKNYQKITSETDTRFNNIKAKQRIQIKHQTKRDDLRLLMLLLCMPWNIVMFMHQVPDAVTSNEEKNVRERERERTKTTKRLTMYTQSRLVHKH